MAPRPGLSTAQRHRSHGRNSKPQTTDTCSPPSTQHYLSAAAGTLLGAAPGRSLPSRERFLCTQNPAGFPWWKLSAPGCPRRVCPSLRAVNQRGDRAHFSIIWSKRHQCSAGAKKVRFQQNSIFSVLVLTKRRGRRKSPWRTHGQMSHRAKQSLLRVGKTFQPRCRMHKLHPEPKAAHHSCALPTAPRRDPELCRKEGIQGSFLGCARGAKRGIRGSHSSALRPNPHRKLLNHSTHPPYQLMVKVPKKDDYLQPMKFRVKRDFNFNIRN